MTQQTTAGTSPPSDEPLYNIGVVARMTGIPVATVRVWERRYKFPESARTPGGHRLYSEKEIMRLRWVKARIDEGMQTGRAIRALQHLETDNQMPDAPLARVKTSQQSPRPASSEAMPAPSDSSLQAFRDRFINALLDHDTVSANQVLADTMALYSIEQLLPWVIQPALVAIGERWHNGEVGVGTEHLATNFVRNRLLSWMNAGPPVYDVPPIVLACAPEEWHEISLLIFGVLLRRRRWPVAYLGQSLPLPDLATFLKDSNTELVILVALTETSGQNLAEWPRWLPDAHRTRKPIISYAGTVFLDTAWQERVPGVYLGDTIEEGMDTVEKLMAEAHTFLD